jgi:PE-PPE domain
MRLAVRSVGVALLALLAAVLLALTSTMTNVTLTAAVYIVKGTNSAFNQIPDSAYPGFAQLYDARFGLDNTPPAPSQFPPSSTILVNYPATFFPVTPPGFIFSPTFDQSVGAGVSELERLRPLNATSSGDILWGYSQGATVVTMYKRDYNNAYPAAGGPVPPTFVLVANPNRPNGGILERGVALGTIPILGLTFSGATPTTTAGAPTGAVTTYDIARQYDGIADAPTNPLNVVADANAILGFALLHSQYPNADLSTAVYQGQYGDTKYYLIPTTTLPLLMPVAMVPVVGPVVATALDPALRVIVEAGYDRTTSPGVPTPFNLLYFPNPVAFGTNLLVAVPTGLDNGLSAVGVGRALGTTPVTNPYGVGGPNPDTGTQAATVAPTSTPANQQALAIPNPTDTTPIDSTPPSTDPPLLNNQLTTPPQPLAPLATKPKLPIIRGPIVNGSSSLPGAKDVASSVNGAVKNARTAIAGGINSVTSAVKNAVSAATGKSSTSNSTSGGSPSNP